MIYLIMQELTKVQSDIVVFIRSFISNQGYCPTLQEVADWAGISVNAMCQNLQRLKKKGVVSWEENSPRTLRVIGERK